MTCSTGAVETTPFLDEAMYDTIAASVIATYNSLPGGCTADVCPRADFAGCIVRFVGHDIMDFRMPLRPAARRVCARSRLQPAWFPRRYQRPHRLPRRPTLRPLLVLL